jgi:c-di-GMP-binding flagellar brake protein YcgR
MAMFERTVSLWRRLTGRPDPENTTRLEDERRLWVRYPTEEVETSYRLANGQADMGRFAARIKDISLAGAQLLVDRAVEPGELLTVELPTRESERRTVLACVVHTRRTGEGEWAVGCNFSRELDEDDLQTFEAARARPASAEDNRYWERFPCRVTATCQVVSAADPSPWETTVLNISASGMAVRVERDIPPGSLLSAELHGSTGKPTVSILACVVHVLARDGGERILGCNFIRELSEQDLAALV